MITGQLLEESKVKYEMTTENIEKYIKNEEANGASKQMVNRYLCAINSVYEYLPNDKHISKEILKSWRKQMTENGYSSATILNYVKYLNRYLDFNGFSSIRFKKGKAKDISGKTFGYLTAIEPTGKKNREDIVWRCRCKCGKEIELPATRLLQGNTLSCGCLQREHLEKINMCIGKTSLRQSLKDNPHNPKNASGYTGVVPKRNKWQAYINYKGKRYALGCYDDIEDAIAARARAKNIVKKDAQNLLKLYNKIHGEDNNSTVDYNDITNGIKL